MANSPKFKENDPEIAKEKKCNTHKKVNICTGKIKVANSIET